MSEKLLSVENLTMKFGGLIAIDDLSSCRTHKVTVFSYNSQNKNWDLINTKTFINHLRSNLSREYICF